MLTIRNIKKGDIKTLARIYKKTYDSDKNGEFWNYTTSKALIDFYCQIKTSIALVAVYDGNICGAFLSFVKPWYDGRHLAEGELFIDPKYQNKGIGTKLYLAMMKDAKKRNCVVHDLIAYNKPGLWYKKIGFKSTGLTHMSGNINEVIKRLSVR